MRGTRSSHSWLEHGVKASVSPSRCINGGHPKGQGLDH